MQAPWSLGATALLRSLTPGHPHMASTVQERFQNALCNGIKASPFTTTTAAPLYLLRGTTRIPLAGCPINYECSTSPLEETGIKPGHTLDVQILKKLVPIKPNHELDALEYQGREYKFQPVTGTEPFSPVWVVHAFSPIGS